MVCVVIMVILVSGGQQMDPGEQGGPYGKHHGYGSEEILYVGDDRFVPESGIHPQLVRIYVGDVEPAGAANLLFSVDMVIVTVRCLPDPFVGQLQNVFPVPEG